MFQKKTNPLRHCRRGFVSITLYTFQIPKFTGQLNNKLYKFQKKPHKNKITKEYIKDKNKENAKRYRQRHKFIYSHIVKENAIISFIK